MEQLMLTKDQFDSATGIFGMLFKLYVIKLELHDDAIEILGMANQHWIEQFGAGDDEWGNF